MSVMFFFPTATTKIKGPEVHRILYFISMEKRYEFPMLPDRKKNPENSYTWKATYSLHIEHGKLLLFFHYFSSFSIFPFFVCSVTLYMNSFSSLLLLLLLDFFPLLVKKYYSTFRPKTRVKFFYLKSNFLQHTY